MASTTEKTTEKKKEEEKVEKLQRPRGTQDILPQEQKYWEYVTETVKSTLRGWHFQRVDTPIFEDKELFERAVGEDTDIVSKEMFELKSRSRGSNYVLRPEGTAAMARSYLEHGMKSWPRPVKLFYVGPFFRYDRPQAGRFRQFHQFGVEVFGSAAPMTDAHVIYLAHVLLQQLGLTEYTVKLNTLGEPEERKDYIKLLKDHYRRNKSKLCRDCKERIVNNPLRVLDCKEEKCQQVSNTAPRLLDHLSDESKKHFESVLSVLEKAEVPHEVAPQLVRGLDYYSHTVFEFVPKTLVSADGAEEIEGSQGTLIAGGRYNKLITQLGGKNTPGVGWAAGIERIIDRLKEEGVELTVTDIPQVFVAQLGEQAKHETLKLLRMLQESGIPFAESMDRDGMQAQLRVADRMGVPWALILGHKEVIDDTVILRNMESGMQEIVPQEKLVEELQRRLRLAIG